MSSDEEPLSPRSAKELCKNNTSATVHAMMRSSKYEREELVRARSKLGEVLSFLKKQGFSEEVVLGDLKSDGFSKEIPCRDEFGLPHFNGSSGVGINLGKNLSKDGGAPQLLVQSPKSDSKCTNPFINKMKGKIDDSSPVNVVLSENNVVNAQAGPPSWSSVVKKGSQEEVLSFDYCPLPDGATMVSPPLEVLKKGVDKFKLYLVGVFSKGTMPLSKVMELSQKSWGNKGLCSVSQKDSHTFLFKFNSEIEMNAVLARGTWYFERKPLILNVWGAELRSDNLSSIPLWVKFENLPDYYWTREGLSCVASSIGPPICADRTTTLLNPVQFAKICVRYKVGDPLPEKVRVAVLDPKTLEVSPSAFVEIAVSYPQRPLFCSGCKQLGHSIGACPSIKRVWVQKPSMVSALEPQAAQSSSDAQTVLKKDDTLMQDVPSNPVVLSVPVTTSSVDPPVGQVLDSACANEEAPWTTVHSKKSGSPKSSSDAPVINSGQMPIFKALAKISFKRSG